MRRFDSDRRLCLKHWIVLLKSAPPFVGLGAFACGPRQRVAPASLAFCRLRRMDTDGLPGAELVDKGIRDLQAGAETVESLLVSLAAPALRSVGLSVPSPMLDPEIRLYRLLALQHGAGAHSRYNALVRRIVSFRRAAACVR